MSLDATLETTLYVGWMTKISLTVGFNGTPVKFASMAGETMDMFRALEFIFHWTARRPLVDAFCNVDDDHEQLCNS